MNKWTTTLSRPILLLCAILPLAAGTGCSESAASRTRTEPVIQDADLEFQKGRGRPPTVKTLYTMSDILATQGKDAECELVLRKILAEHPGFVPAYNRLAELLLRRSRITETIEVISQGLQIQPNDPVLLNNYGMCWLMRREYDKALKMFTAAAGRMPENARYRANMAVVLGLMGRDEESLALFKQVLPEDQANHNLSVLCRARDASGPSHEQDNNG